MSKPARQGRTASKKPPRRSASSRSPRSPRPPSVAGLAASVVRGAGEVLALTDPLEVESWASSIMGTFYKLAVPLEARDEIEKQLWPGGGGAG